MDLNALIKAITTAKHFSTLRGVIDELIQATSGITSFSYIVHQYHALHSQPRVITHYPSDWIKLYQQKNYLLIDPVIKDVFSRNLPFVWNYRLYFTRINEQQAQLFEDSANNGICAGIACPIHGPAGEVGSTFFALENAENFINDMYSFNQWDLLTLSMVYHETVKCLINKKEIKTARLTDREIDCLVWSAKGKTAYETGIILGLSEQTVRTYLKSCTSKLEANNKTHAVVKALMQNDLAYHDINWLKAQIIQ